MTEKLRSHLKKDQGFTLIELLVVIAIIAILVVIVVVAINPVQRIQDANDRSASANVRSAGTLISTCITQELAGGTAAATVFSTGAGGCGAAGTLQGYGTVPSGVVLGAEAGVKVCVHAVNAGGSGTVSWNSEDGAVTAPGAGVTTCA